MQYQFNKLLKKYIKEISYCTFCAKMCRFACPIAKVEPSETTTPTGKMLLFYLLMRGELQLTEELITTLLKCTNCLICNNYCKHNINIPSIIQRLREIIFNEYDPLRGITLSLEKYKNPYNKDITKNLDVILNKYFTNQSGIFYLPGCTAINYYPQDIIDTIKILERLNISFSLSREYICCGYIYFLSGNLKEYEKYKRELMKLLKKFKIIITNCPQCCYHLKSINLPALHITQFLEDKLFPNPAKIEYQIIYHDPCYLGRYLNSYTSPRNILKRITQPVEFFYNRENSTCCGANILLRLINPEVSKKITKLRLEEENIKEKVLVTACSNCKHNFEGKIKTKDIVNLIVECYHM